MPLCANSNICPFLCAIDWQKQAICHLVNQWRRMSYAHYWVIWGLWINSITHYHREYASKATVGDLPNFLDYHLFNDWNAICEVHNSINVAIKLLLQPSWWQRTTGIWHECTIVVFQGWHQFSISYRYLVGFRKIRSERHQMHFHLYMYNIGLHNGGHSSYDNDVCCNNFTSDSHFFPKLIFVE